MKGVIIFVAIAACVLLIAIGGMWSLVTYKWTIYAPGFSHSGWRQVTNGMAAADVRNCIGGPFRDSGSSSEPVWDYSRGYASIFRYYFLIMTNGAVAEKRSPFTR